MEITPQMALQIRVSKMPGYGFAFSIVWAGGVGSLIALIIGLRARNLIKQSNGEISGMKLAWWCIVVGALGVLTILPYVIRLTIKAVKQ
jgi:hypothetical protein